jgi:WhiB family redox-sensing transcriptional regulator
VAVRINERVSLELRAFESWRSRAACRGPETALFFPPTHPERRDERDARELRAKAICRECPVTQECLEHALRAGETHGIWGGLTESERRGLLEAV